MEVENFRERELLIKYANVIKLGEAFVALKKEFEESVDSDELKKIDKDKLKELDRRYALVNKGEVDQARIDAEEARKERRKNVKNTSKPASESMVKVEALVSRADLPEKQEDDKSKKENVKSKEVKNGKKG